MTKVLHYVTIMNRAGEETFIMNLFRSIDKSKVIFDFLVTSMNEGDYDKEILSLGGSIKHITLNNTKSPLNRINKYFQLRDYLKDCSSEYSTFHIHTQHAMDALLDAIAAKRAGFKTVIVHSHSTQTLFHTKAHYICRPLLNFIHVYRFACSEKAGRWLYGEHGRFEVINNGIMTENFVFDEAVRQMIRKSENWTDHTVIGHVGSFTYPKNHLFLLKVFKEYLKKDPNAILVMAGKGELLEETKKKAQIMGISDNTVFLGGRSDVNKLYSAFDALVFPSHYEGLPVTLVEAQAADLPCLISDAITEEIDLSSKMYRMSLKETPSLWADQLEQILMNKERNSAIDIIINAGFDIQTTVSRILEIYLGNNESQFRKR